MVHSGNWMSYPWLCVDLGKEALVYSVGIFNRYNGKVLIKISVALSLCMIISFAFPCMYDHLENI